VAANPNTSVSLLARLLRDDSEDVLKFVVPRYLTHFPEQISLVEKFYRQELTYSYSRLVMLFHPQISPDLLRKNSRSLSWLERYAIAQNPNTPQDILQNLRQDTNRIVKAAALNNPG